MTDPSAVTTREFLAAIWGEVPGVAELTFGRPSPEDRRRDEARWSIPFHNPADLDKVGPAIEAQKDANIFFGPGLRREVFYQAWKAATEAKDQAVPRGAAEDVEKTSVLWVDVPFSRIPRPEAVTLFKRFPLPVSVAVDTGTSYEAYWILKSPVGRNELLAALPFCEAISPKLFAGSFDLASVLRVPGTLNHSVDPPAAVKVHVWRPEIRHRTLDFTTASAAMSAGDAGHLETLPRSSSIDPADLPLPPVVREILKGGKEAYRAFRERTDTPDKFDERKVTRSAADAFVVLKMLLAGCTADQIVGVYKNPDLAIGEKYRERGDSYLLHQIASCQDFIKVKPRTSAESAAVKVGAAVDRDYEDAKFRIVRVVRFAQQPPTYKITTLVGTEERTTVCNVEDLYRYAAFQKCYFGTHDRFLPPQNESTWQKMYEEADKETVEVEEGEGTLDGQVRQILDEAVGTALGENAGIAGLKHMAIRKDSGDVLIQLPVLMKLLRSNSVEARRHQVCHMLKEWGWEHRTHRFGKVVTSAWSRIVLNGHPKQKKDEEEGLFDGNLQQPPVAEGEGADWRVTSREPGSEG